MSISSSLAHKYDEFDEFSQPSAPKSAYEELKAWCEKHLEPREYKILPETKSYGLSIVLEDEYEIGFYSDGRFLNIWGVDNDTLEHAQECEAYESAKR